jgi:hypothetical protein
MFRRKNVAKGWAAGAIGGLVGTIVMTQFQNAWQKSSRSLKREEESQPEVMSSSAQAEETWGIQTGTEGASRSTAKVYSVRQTGAKKREQIRKSNPAIRKIRKTITPPPKSPRRSPRWGAGI